MKDKPHVLFISSWYPSPTTSEGTFVEMHLLALQSRGCRCAILLNGEMTLGNFVRSRITGKQVLNFRRRDDIQFIDNAVVHRLPLRLVKDPLAERKKNLTAGALKACRAYVKKYGKPDAIFHHGIFDNTYISKHLSQELDIPIWYMENSPNIDEQNFPCANPFETDESLIEFVRSAEKRFAVTDAYVRKMEKVFGVSFRKVPNVLTDDYFVAEPADRPSDEFVFVNVAILDERKRQDLIIRAFAAEFKTDEKYRLVIAGDGRLRDSLINLAGELGVAERVEVPGFLSRSEVKALLDRSHAFVLASRAETFGVVVVEALARGIPVISSDIDGTCEIINSKNGILFESGNVEDLAKAMRHLIGNYDLYRPVDLVQDVRRRFGPDAVKRGLFENE
jgi:glycosyltransferase involved in cell wall biosynthesis